MLQQFVWFRVYNTWTEILQADQYILKILSKESSYPTNAAELLKWQRFNNNSLEVGWDGWIRLLRTPKTKYPYFPTGLVPRLTRICKKLGYEVHIEDRRQRPQEGFPEHSKNGVIVDRDYQLEAVKSAVKLGRGVLDMPPRSGKTRTMIEIHRQFSLPTLWIAPTVRIVDQTAKVITEFFGKNYVANVGDKLGLEVLKNSRIVICTASAAIKLSEEIYATREMLIVDEWHHGAAKTYTKDVFPKCDHIYFRFGMTGTHFRSGEDALAMHGLLSDVIYKVSTPFLLQRGFLVPTKVAFIPMPAYPKVRGVGKTFASGHGKHGIHVHKGRNQLVTHAAFYLNKMGRKVLILVGTKAQGYMIQKMLSQFILNDTGNSGYEFQPVEFLSTDVPRHKQARILDSYLSNQEVQVLIGTSLLGEGVDLPYVDALVYARGEKAEVSLRQNWFRVCTAIEGKRNAIIVDFADRHNRNLLKHSHDRLDAYYTEPIFSTTILQDVNGFVPWIEKLGQESAPKH